MTRCVLFDIDNTLLFKKPTIPEAVFRLAVSGNPQLTMDAVEKAYAASELWQGRQIMRENETGVRMDDGEYLRNVTTIYADALRLDKQIVSRLETLFGRSYTQAYEPAPGVMEVLAFLRDKGILMGIVSNNHSAVRQVLDEMGLSSFFSCVVISEEVELYKPDPKILELACRELDVPCGESVYVGDHPFDILCAHEAGMPVAWLPVNAYMAVPEGISPPEYTLASLRELPHALFLQA